MLQGERELLKTGKTREAVSEGNVHILEVVPDTNQGDRMLQFKLIKCLRTTVISVMAVVFLLTVVPQDTVAQLSKKQQKQLQKQRDKQYKSKLKEYKSQNWQLGASSRTMEVVLLEHYQKLGEEGNTELVGEVSQCQSINVCRQFALSNALNNYSTKATGHVKGRIETMMRADANMPQIEMDKFIAGYENMVKAEVSGVLTESYSIVKDGKNNLKEYKTFFLVNEEKAMLARKKAMERSLLETKIAIKEAEEISKFVNEGFSLE